MRPPRPILKMIGPTIFSVELKEGGVGGTSNPRGSTVAPTNVRDRSVRPLIGYGRGDRPVSSETPVETHVTVLEQKRSPWPIT